MSGGIAKDAAEQAAIAGHVAERSERANAIQELPQLGAADRGVGDARGMRLGKVVAVDRFDLDALERTAAVAAEDGQVIDQTAELGAADGGVEQGRAHWRRRRRIAVERIDIDAA